MRASPSYKIPPDDLPYRLDRHSPRGTCWMGAQKGSLRQ